MIARMKSDVISSVLPPFFRQPKDNGSSSQAFIKNKNKTQKNKKLHYHTAYSFKPWPISKNIHLNSDLANLLLKISSF